MPSSWIIGARSDCDLVLDVASVSGRHCRLSREEAGFFLEDLNSTNGTFVNGVRLPPNVRVPVKPDDLVHLGSHAVDVRSLIARVDTQAADSLEFRGQEIVVGRTAASDRVIDQPMVSSRHARLFQVGNEILIEDLNSANGTFVNGKRIDRATAVRPGDKIGLGSYSLTLAVPMPARASRGSLAGDAAGRRGGPAVGRAVGLESLAARGPGCAGADRGSLARRACGLEPDGHLVRARDVPRSGSACPRVRRPKNWARLSRGPD